MDTKRISNHAVNPRPVGRGYKLPLRMKSTTLAFAVWNASLVFRHHLSVEWFASFERNKSLEPTTPFTPEMDRKLKRWYTKHGVSQSVIAERLELSLQQVNRRVATLG